MHMKISKDAWIARMDCAICDSSETTEERRIAEFPLQRCDSCGFLQTGRILSSKILDAFYSAGYDGKRLRQGQQINAEINMEVMRRFGLTVTSGQTMLDIGCGYGFFMRRMQDLTSANTAGIELSQAQLSYARESLGLTVERDISALPERFLEGVDLMVCFEVIEHISDPIDFLRDYTQRLRPGGTLVLATDNFSSLPVRTMGDSFPKWIPHQHISLFDPASLEKSLTRAGLEVSDRISFTPWELLLRALVYRASMCRVGGRRFDLASELRTENSRSFAAFRARLAFNRLWFRFAQKRDLSGEMMFIAARRAA